MGLAVLFSPRAFSCHTTYLLASGGMAYMNLNNLRRARTMLLPAPGAGAGGKAHAE